MFSHHTLVALETPPGYWYIERWCLSACLSVRQPVKPWSPITLGGHDPSSKQGLGTHPRL